MLNVADQGTAEWKQDRAGYCTASRFGEVISKGKKSASAPGGYLPSKSRATYLLQLVAERITGAPYDSYSGGAATQRGGELEHDARTAYMHHTGNLVIPSPFVPHPKIEWCGASPDGLVGEDGGIEIKCPANPMIHLETVLLGNARLAAALLGEIEEKVIGTADNRVPPKTKPLIPPEHMAQVQGNMWVHERQWWDFISYDPRFPAHLQLYVHRVFRDPEYIEMLEREVVKFLDEVNDNVSRLILPEEGKAHQLTGVAA
jgi:hypothetical protein